MGATPNICAGPFGALYSFYIERPRLMQAVGRTTWGIDSAPIYDTLKVLRTVADGAVVADVPCGSGLALRELPHARKVRYLAGDLDSGMLARTRRRAAASGLEEVVETLVADMEALPFEDSSVDVFMCVSGLHMVASPARAIAEIARTLKPGGVLHGTTFVREGTLRQRLLFGAGALRGHPLPPSFDALLSTFDHADLETLAISPRRGMCAFRARRRG